MTKTKQNMNSKMSGIWFSKFFPVTVKSEINNVEIEVKYTTSPKKESWTAVFYCL